MNKYGHAQDFVNVVYRNCDHCNVSENVLLVSLALEWRIINESGTNAMNFYALAMVDVRNSVSGKFCSPALIFLL